MNPNTKNNSAIVDSCGLRIVAVKKYITNSKTDIPLAGELHKPADIVAFYQSTIDARRLVVTKRAELQSAILDRTTIETQHRAIDAGLKWWVINRFGVDSTEAHDFGFGPKKPPQKTAETKALAVKKLRATREARHTMGKRQKKDVKGTVVQAAPAAAPPTTSAAPSTSAQPATAPVSVIVNNGPQAAAGNAAAQPAGSNGAQPASNGVAAATAPAH